MHIFGPPARFPLARERRYTPPEASLEALLALHERLGLERVLIVQPSVYGTDNSCTLDALRRLGPRARGVAVTDTRIRENELRRLKRLPVALVVDHFGLAQSTDEVRYLASLLREGNTYVKLSGPHACRWAPDAAALERLRGWTAMRAVSQNPRRHSSSPLRFLDDPAHHRDRSLRGVAGAAAQERHAARAPCCRQDHGAYGLFSRRAVLRPRRQPLR
ncbi:MAG TPA: amidohydrolase family protein, partial [Burkholderiales bacterium]|nr:amidohydrolase family protein [Burkholderiales bacterium]